MTVGRELTLMIVATITYGKYGHQLPIPYTTGQGSTSGHFNRLCTINSFCQHWQFHSLATQIRGVMHKRDPKGGKKKFISLHNELDESCLVAFV